jgi:hypothetical protein
MVIAANGIVEAEPAAVFAFLSDLRNHWQLTGRWVRVLNLTGPDLGPTGGWVELRGPLGMRRRLKTTVIETEEPARIDGMAELGSRTRTRVSWVLAPQGQWRTAVRLEAQILSADRVDRVLLSVGAGRWLGARFQATLGQLSLLLAPQHRGERSEVVHQPLGPRVIEDPFAL